MPEPWQTNARGPFMTIGEVSVFALGGDRDEPDPSAHVGRDAFERLLDGFLESFGDLRFDVLELIDVGDRQIASTMIDGRGTASGASVEDAYVVVYRLRDGLVVEGWEYGTEQEALEAVGLE